MADVSIHGAGVTVTIPFTTSENAHLAQLAAAGFAGLSTVNGTLFVDPPGAPTTTGATGLIISNPGVSVTGTANNATVIAGGSNITYTSKGNNQKVFFSTSGVENLLKNGTALAHTTYYIDAGGSAATAGTTVNATLGAATVNAFSGYLDLLAGSGSFAGSGGVLLHDQGGNVSIHGGNATIGGSGSVTLAGGNFNIVPYSADAFATPTLAATVPSLTAVGTANVIKSGIGINVSLASGAAVSLQGVGATPNDSITALGSDSIFVSGANALVSQTGAGNLSIGSGTTGQVTVNTAASALETINYANKTRPLVVNVADGNNLSLTGGGSFLLKGTGSDTIEVSKSTTVNLAGGSFAVTTAGAGGRITFSGADTVSFASSTLAASVLGATTVGLKSGAGNITDKTTATGKTLLFTGTDTNTGTYFLVPTGKNVLYFGTVARTDWNGVPVESTGFTATNVVVSVAGAGSETVFGGGSADGGVLLKEYGGTSGSNLLVGALSIFGGGTGDTLQAGAYTTYIQAASTGTATLIGGDLTAVGETLIGGGGANTFIFGTGNETIVGGKGVDQFEDIARQASGTTITITDFVHGTDKVDLFSVTNTSLSGATADLTLSDGLVTVSGGNTYLRLSDGVTIQFVGDTNVTASDFVTAVGGVQVGKVIS